MMTEPDTGNQQESQKVRRREQNEKTPLGSFFGWTTLVLTTVGAGYIWILLIRYSWSEAPWFMTLLEEHFAAFFGIPMATMIALAVVIVLSISAGPIKFEAPGIKLRGAAGEVLFWVICFLSVITALRWLW